MDDIISGEEEDPFALGLLGALAASNLGPGCAYVTSDLFLKYEL